MALQTGDPLLARRIGRLRAQLDGTVGSSSITRALDDVGRTLDHLRSTCTDDRLALRLGSSRAVAGSYVRAASHLREAGARSELCEIVLQEGRAKVSHDLADVQRALVQAPGAT